MTGIIKRKVGRPRAEAAYSVISVTISKPLFDEVDRRAKLCHKTRSAILSESISRYFNGDADDPQVAALRRKLDQISEILDEGDAGDENFDEFDLECDYGDDEEEIFDFECDYDDEEY